MPEITPTDEVENSALAMVDNLGRRMSNPKLMALRAQCPFIPIMQFPNSGVNVLLQAGVAQDINIPSEAKLAQFSGDQVYYVSRQGNAQIPLVGQNSQSVALQNPESVFYYVEEVQSLSVISPVSCYLTVNYFSQT